MLLSDKGVVEYWFLRGFDGDGGEEKWEKWDRLIELARKGADAKDPAPFSRPVMGQVG